MKRYAAVIFDWDGTIMDSTHSIVAAIQGACQDLGLPVPSASQASWVIGLSLETALYRVVPTLTAEQLPLFVEGYRSHFYRNDRDVKLFDGISCLLNELRAQHVVLGVATGKTRVGLDRVLGSMNMHDHFDITRCADEAFGKPHPAMLLQIMEERRLDPDTVLMVGDTTHDIQMAQNAGIDCLAVSYGAHDIATLTDARPTGLIHSVAEMQDWLSLRVQPMY